jgi:hypothetical protein
MRYSPTANLYERTHWMPRGRREPGPLVPTSAGPGFRVIGDGGPHPRQRCNSVQAQSRAPRRQQPRCARVVPTLTLVSGSGSPGGEATGWRQYGRLGTVTPLQRAGTAIDSRPPAAPCRCLPRPRDCAGPAYAHVSHSRNVASIVSRRAGRLGDLVKPRIDPKILPKTRIFHEVDEMSVRPATPEPSGAARHQAH